MIEQDPGGGQKGWDEDTKLSGISEPKVEDASSSREQAACSGLGCFPQAGGEARAVEEEVGDEERLCETLGQV